MNSRSLGWFSFLPLLPILQFLILMPQLDSAILDSNPDELYYQSCGNMFNCGYISDVGYPFRSYNGPEYCGHPGFELSCNEGNTTIDIMNQTYRVLKINQASKTMKIVREDIMEGNCTQKFVNTTLDNSLFEYTTAYINLTFLYGAGVSENCSSRVMVPVPVVGAGYGGFVIDSTLLMKTLKEGQEIRWKMDSKACDDCTKSKGRGKKKQASNVEMYLKMKEHSWHKLLFAFHSTEKPPAMDVLTNSSEAWEALPKASKAPSVTVTTIWIPHPKLSNDPILGDVPRPYTPKLELPSLQLKMLEIEAKDTWFLMMQLKLELSLDSVQLKFSEIGSDTAGKGRAGILVLRAGFTTVQP
nr:LEAF RUST 10 DISEASE-RESISTANCE LOCUS RECEPTOR-LIKE PROTEIN KINASE-like 1.4 isoform X2 [Ipomoea batatas]GMD57037.1 LEAF RUST 10 DISEASE-RESISTANCE LOCUS RECEPTOR-LIKE PROTEIN KINASE-like 1.4 isoform X2 [Ipomoea batatas]